MRLEKHGGGYWEGKDAHEGRRKCLLPRALPDIRGFQNVLEEKSVPYRKKSRKRPAARAGIGLGDKGLPPSMGSGDERKKKEISNQREKT